MKQIFQKYKKDKIILKNNSITLNNNYLKI